MSYQTEERLWTDYVRVATPIVGLLLLLGVFWYWASSLIGDDSGNPPPTLLAVDVTVIPANTFTPTATQEVVLPPNTVVPSPTEGTDSGIESTADTGGPATEAPTETPTDEPIDTGDDTSALQEGDVVTVIDDDVNLRSEPSTNAEVVAVLTKGTELTIIDGVPQESDGIVFWHVRNDATGDEGWVSQDWFKK